MQLRSIMVALAAAASLVVAPSTPATARTCAPPPPTSLGEVTPVAVGLPLVSQETTIRWTRATVRLTYGDDAILEGQVVTDEGALADAPVDLYARLAGQDEWSLVASTSSDPETGVFAFGCLLPGRTTTYRASYAGSPTYGASEGVRRVEVSRRMPDSMRQVSPSRFVYSGSVAPRYSGTVTLQRRDCASCAWRKVATDRTDTGSAWRFTVDVARLSGRYDYRATIPADAHFARSRSEGVWRITVR